MSLELMSIILVGSLMLFFAMGLEIGIAIAVVASMGLLLFIDQPLGEFAYSAWGYMNSFTLTAVPLFVFMGTMFSSTGTITKLFWGADRILGFLPGGVACSVLGANAIFGAISGSSVAATATFGKIAYPNMEKLGYEPKLSLGSIAAGGTLSVLIPPSVVMIYYGTWQEVSVAKLFAAGLIPGLILATLLMLTVILRVKFNPSLAPRRGKYSWKDRVIALREIAPFLIAVVVVLGTIFSGIMTPTEAASLGAVLSIIIALSYRRLTFAAFKESMWSAMKITAMLALVVFPATVLAKVFQYIGLTDLFAGFMLDLPFGKYGILTIICIMYLILGMFFVSLAMLVLTLPFVAPIIFSLGFDITWFGIIFVVLAEIGLITPPFGLNLFTLNTVVPKHSLLTIAHGSLPFLVPMLIVIVLLVAFPQLALWLPGILY